MTEQSFYVHGNGETSGPFTKLQILEQVTGGTLATVEFIALDGQWTPIQSWLASLAPQRTQREEATAASSALVLTPPSALEQSVAAAAVTSVPAKGVAQVKRELARRLARLPISDWIDHCAAGRSAQAIEAVHPDRLRTSFDLAIEEVAKGTGAALDGVQAAVVWTLYQERLEQVRLAHTACLETVNSQEVGSLLQKGVELIGDCVATTPIGQLAAGALSLGIEKLVEAEVKEAQQGMATALDGYDLFTSCMLDRIFAAPPVVAAYERRQNWQVVGVFAALALAVAGILVAVRVGYYSSDSSPNRSEGAGTSSAAQSATGERPNQNSLTETVSSTAASSQAESGPGCSKTCASKCGMDARCQSRCEERTCQ